MAVANEILELNVIANPTNDRIEGLSDHDDLFKLNATYPQTMIFNRSHTIWAKAIPYLEGEIRIYNDIVDKIIRRGPSCAPEQETRDELSKAMNDLINTGLLLGKCFSSLKNFFTVAETYVATSLWSIIVR